MLYKRPSPRLLYYLLPIYWKKRHISNPLDAQTTLLPVELPPLTGFALRLTYPELLLIVSSPFTRLSQWNYFYNSSMAYVPYPRMLIPQVCYSSIQFNTVPVVFPLFFCTMVPQCSIGYGNHSEECNWLAFSLVPTRFIPYSSRSVFHSIPLQ